MANHVMRLANESDEWKRRNDSVHTFWPVPSSSAQVAHHQTQTWQEVQQLNPVRVCQLQYPRNEQRPVKWIKLTQVLFLLLAILQSGLTCLADDCHLQMKIHMS
jgi:hypothetical protein